jgi:hypothetical protein
MNQSAESAAEHEIQTCRDFSGKTREQCFSEGFKAGQSDRDKNPSDEVRAIIAALDKMILRSNKATMVNRGKITRDYDDLDALYDGQLKA